MRKRFSEEQIIGVLKEAGTGIPLAEILRRYGIHENTYRRWKSKYGGMEVGEARRLKHLEDENHRLKKMVANLMLDIEILKDINSKNWSGP